MAEMFLKLDGVNGESLDEKHHDEIEINKWDWSTENHVKWDLNQGGQSTKVDVHAITIDKICDKASVVLYQCCVTGKHIPTARITCRKNDGDQKVEYLVVDLKDIMVSKVNWSGDGGQQSLGETVDLQFAEFKLHYLLQADTGDSAAKGATSFGFNIQKQQKT
jgi:type VI secretion system secreted protein Hcp